MDNLLVRYHNMIMSNDYGSYKAQLYMTIHYYNIQWFDEIVWKRRQNYKLCYLILYSRI